MRTQLMQLAKAKIEEDLAKEDKELDELVNSLESVFLDKAKRGYTNFLIKEKNYDPALPTFVNLRKLLPKLRIKYPDLTINHNKLFISEYIEISWADKNV